MPISTEGKNLEENLSFWWPRRNWPHRQIAHTWSMSLMVFISNLVYAVALNSYPCQHRLRSLLKCRLQGPPRGSDSVVLGWAPVICILNWHLDYSDGVKMMCRLGKHWIIWTTGHISRIMFCDIVGWWFLRLLYMQNHKALVGPDELRCFQPRPDPFSRMPCHKCLPHCNRSMWIYGPTFNFNCYSLILMISLKLLNSHIPIWRARIISLRGCYYLDDHIYWANIRLFSPHSSEFYPFSGTFLVAECVCFIWQDLRAEELRNTRTRVLRFWRA